MNVESFARIIGSDFYTGVPDSQLKAFCNYLMGTYGLDPKHHIIAANEGNCTAIAAGYHLATGKVPVVYMQNSGEGNVINPVASLLNDKVYAIPCIFVIGWRGEPGVHDEPQHIFQGEITCEMLELLQIKYMVVSKETTEGELTAKVQEYVKLLSAGQSVAFVIRKDGLSYNGNIEYGNDYLISREEAIDEIMSVAEDDVIVCTTGKAGRELFELREKRGESHENDFLTVGSMGHASSIALGIATNTDKRVWCIDGDGALIMHMGAMATIGHFRPKNLIHIIIDNESHETVGGMPTVVKTMDVCEMAKKCGYSYTHKVFSIDELKDVLKVVELSNELTMVDIKCKCGSRENLGRPTIRPVDNKRAFMGRLAK